jgi:Trk K+ transport system NAD-binding subunit
MPRRVSRRDRDHLIVCGDNSLAARVVEELTTSYGEQVTVLLRSRDTGQGTKIAALPRVRVIERTELNSDAFAAAGVQSARAVALLGQDDLGNFHAALRAQELNKNLRVVMAIFNTRLGDRIRTFFDDCAVLSDSAMAAPSFVAAALGEAPPGHVRVAGQTLYVTRRDEVSAQRVVCGLAETTDPLSPRLLPFDAGSADLVLAAADGAPRPLPRPRRRALRSTARAARGLLGHKLGVAFLILIVVLVLGFALLATASGFSLGNAAYLTFLDAAGAAVSSPGLPTAEKLAQVLLTFDGMAFLPVITAAVVGARLTGSLRGRERPLSDHVIVVGLGNVGTRVVGQLHDLGIDVACVDRNPSAMGMALARRLGLRVVIGEAYREETLRAAGIDTCQALVSVTSNDIVNLETALHARALVSDLRLVLRLGDDDLAQRVQRNAGGGTVSRSVAYLAAPTFAAAMLEHQVLRTIPVGRHVLLVADIRVDGGSELAGKPIAYVIQAGRVSVLAVQQGAGRVEWGPDRDLALSAGDRMFVLATRAGLSGVLARSRPPA